MQHLFLSNTTSLLVTAPSFSTHHLPLRQNRSFLLLITPLLLLQRLSFCCNTSPFITTPPNPLQHKHSHLSSRYNTSPSTTTSPLSLQRLSFRYRTSPFVTPRLILLQHSPIGLILRFHNKTPVPVPPHHLSHNSPLPFVVPPLLRNSGSPFAIQHLSFRYNASPFCSQSTSPFVTAPHLQAKCLRLRLG